MQNKTLETTIRAMLRPLVRLSLRHGLGSKMLISILKEILINEAFSQLLNRGEKVTVSGLSVMLGLSRREIRKTLDGEQESQPRITASMRVLGKWEQSSEFLTRNKKPRILSYDYEDSEFYSLVRSVSKDLNPAAVLRELLRLGTVEIVPRGVKLVQAVANYQGTPEKAFDLLARDINTLVISGEENIYEEEEIKNLHIRTEYDNINPESLPEIRKWILKEGQEFHKKVRIYLAKHDLDISPTQTKSTNLASNNSEEKARVVVKAFSWCSNSSKN